jgi:hypothetical protein
MNHSPFARVGIIYNVPELSVKSLLIKNVLPEVLATGRDILLDEECHPGDLRLLRDLSPLHDVQALHDAQQGAAVEREAVPTDRLCPMIAFDAGITGQRGELLGRLAIPWLA